MCASGLRYVQGELLSEPAAVLLLGLHGVEVGQLDDVGPHSRTGTTAQPAATEHTEERLAADLTLSALAAKDANGPTTDQSKSLLVRLDQWCAAYLMSSSCSSS